MHVEPEKPALYSYTYSKDNNYEEILATLSLFTDSYEVRNPSFLDSESLTSLWQVAFSGLPSCYRNALEPKFIPGLLSREDFLWDCSWLVADKVRGEIVGATLMAKFSGVFPYIASIAVAPGHQGKGIGTFILAKALSTAKSYTFEGRFVLADVRRSNDKSVALFQKMGFK